jgi:hypothetical protein
MHCKFLKLTNGEDIIVSTDDECMSFKGKEFIDVFDPVQISTMRFPRGNKLVETYILQPWIKMCVPDIVKIPTHSIVVAVDVNSSALEQYKQYVEESSSQFSMHPESITGDCDDEGYEELIDSLLGDATEEEDDGNARSTTTYH